MFECLDFRMRHVILHFHIFNCVDSHRPAVQSERKPAGDKKSESPSSQLLTSANFLLRGDLSSAASAALSASGQNVSSPGLLKRELNHSNQYV